MPCIIGAFSIVKRERMRFDCIIKKIECKIPGKSEKAVLVFPSEKSKDSGKDAKKNIVKDKNKTKDNGQSMTDNKSSDLMLVGSVEYFSGDLIDLYFISNYKGKEIDMCCTRDKNHCRHDSHSKYVLDYVDINTGDLKSETRDVGNGKLKLYYYDLYKGLVDNIVALRFIHLPVIREKDYKYESHASLYYTDCQAPGVPTICIHVYPDIEYSLKLGAFGISRTYTNPSAKDKKDVIKATPFSVEFSVKYAGVTRKISFENEQETKLDEETKRGSLFYKTFKFLKDLLSDLAELSETLRKTVKETCGDDDDGVAKDLEQLRDGFMLTSKISEYVSGSLSFSPELSAKWSYAASDNLRELKRQIELDLSGTVSGKLTVDMIAVGVAIMKNTKRATTAVGVGSAATGVGAIPGFILKIVSDVVINWLIKEFKKDVYCKLVFSADAAGKISFDSLAPKETGPKLELTLKAKFETGFKHKTSKVISLEIKGGIESSIAVVFEFSLHFTPNIQLDFDSRLEPLEFKMEFSVVCSFNISYKKSYKKKIGGKKFERHSLVLWHLDNGQTDKSSGGGFGGGGGGGRDNTEAFSGEAGSKKAFGGGGGGGRDKPFGGEAGSKKAFGGGGVGGRDNTEAFSGEAGSKKAFGGGGGGGR